MIPGRQRERHWAGYQRVMATGRTDYGDSLLEVPALRRDGTRLSIAFTVTLVRDDTGRVEGVAVVLRDDTSRWRERRLLRDELAVLRATDAGRNT